MSRADDVRFGLRAARALRAAGVLRPVAPRRAVAARTAARTLHATPASSIAIGAALTPSAVAVADDRGHVTWEELDARVRAVAAVLRDEHGAGPDRPVGVLCRNHAGLLEAVAAAARCGADVLALNTELAPPQLAAVLDRESAAVVVHDAEFAGRLDAAGYAGSRVVAWEEDDAGADASLRAYAAAGVPAADVLPARRSRIVILTSGTTGVPKGASRDLPLRTLLGSLVTLIESLGLHRTGPVFVAPPLFHGFGLAFASIAHGLGAPVVLRRRFDPEIVLAAVEREHVHTLVAVPVMLTRLLSVPPGRHDTSSLRAVISAGSPLAPHVCTRFMDAFGDILANGYGSTETGFGAIATAADLRAAPGCVGRAPVGGALRILDDENRPVPAGTVGHVFVGGDLVFEGYTGGGSKAVVGGLMNTGDLGHVDADGRAFIDGREDDMIVSGGENVFPQEVEDALAAHPSVADVAVLGVVDDEFGQRLLAFVVPDDEGDEQALAERLEAHLRDRLERYKLPREYRVVQAIPRTPTGKVLRRELA